MTLLLPHYRVCASVAQVTVFASFQDVYDLGKHTSSVCQQKNTKIYTSKPPRGGCKIRKNHSEKTHSTAAAAASEENKEKIIFHFSFFGIVSISHASYDSWSRPGWCSFIVLRLARKCCELHEEETFGKNHSGQPHSSHLNPMKITRERERDEENCHKKQQTEQSVLDSSDANWPVR